MKPILFHLYGPFAIHSYGLMIAIGLIITLFFLHKDKKLQSILSEEQFTNLFQVSFLAGITGGRLWYLTTNWSSIDHWYEIFEIWNGGLSILGCILAILLFAPLYLHANNVPILPTLDRIAIYTPLLQSISRFGCFFAGCCHGIPSHVAWSTTYTDPNSLAPLHIPFHPTQLYSVILLFISFLLLQFLARKKAFIPGILTCLYILCVSFERFIVDFWRGDREFLYNKGFFKNFSIQQLLAILMFIGAIFIIVALKKHKKTQ